MKSTGSSKLGSKFPPLTVREEVKTLNESQNKDKLFKGSKKLTIKEIQALQKCFSVIFYSHKSSFRLVLSGGRQKASPPPRDFCASAHLLSIYLVKRLTKIKINISEDDLRKIPLQNYAHQPNTIPVMLLWFDTDRKI